MRYNGLYFIPAPTNAPEAPAAVLAALMNNLETRFDDATRQSPWGLVHRLLRSVVPPSASPNQQTPSLQHVLQLSYLSTTRTYCYIHPSSPPPTQSALTSTTQIKTEAPSQAPTPQPQTSTQSSSGGSHEKDKGTIISIPVTQSDAHISLLVNQLSPLWSFRHALSLQNGLTYSVGQFLVNLGELRASRQGTTSLSNTTTAGVVVYISTIAGADEDGEEIGREGYVTLNKEADELEAAVDLVASQALVRALWEEMKAGIEFGKTEAREYFMAKEVVEGERQTEAVVRMWCELLRMRG